jgi:hypothetical protein
VILCFTLKTLRDIGSEISSSVGGRRRKGVYEQVQPDLVEFLWLKELWRPTVPHAGYHQEHFLVASWGYSHQVRKAACEVTGVDGTDAIGPWWCIQELET